MNVAQAILAASRTPVAPATVFSCMKTDIFPSNGRRTRGKWRHNLTTDTATGYTNRRDWQAKAMGDFGTSAFATNGSFATATTATSLTNSGATFPTAGQALAGKIVACGPNNAGTGSIRFAVIVSNTATALTVDQWYDPTSTVAASGSTPNATASYVILPGQFPAPWMAVTQNAAAPTSADTVLTAELTTADWLRSVGTYAHTAAASTYTLAHTWTSTSTVTINKEAIFGAVGTTAGGVMPFESAEPSPPTLVSGDTLAQTVTITIN